MNLDPNEFQREIADTARAFLAERMPIAHLRKLAADPSEALPEADWRAAADMGWLAVMVPEADGGLGLGMADAVMIAVELGRQLAPGPLRSTALAAWLAARAGESALAAELAAGTRRAGLAYGETAIDTRPGDLLLAVGPTGATLHEVTGTQAVASVDPGVRLARVTTGAQRATLTGGEAMTRLRLMVAAELLGIVEAVRDMSAEYAKVRIQFGRPIGTFQAVKHRCAEMAIKGYALRSQLYFAAVRFDSGCEDASFQCASALIMAMDAARRSCADNIQNHGGIGMTMEQDAHLYLKRALLLDHVCGPRRATHDAVMALPRHDFN